MGATYRIDASSGAGSSDLTAIGRSFARTEERFARMVTSPLGGAGSVLTNLAGGARYWNGLRRQLEWPSRLMQDVLESTWRYYDLMPALAIGGPNGRAAANALHMDLLYRATGSGPYSTPRSTAGSLSPGLGLLVVRALSRAGPAPPGFWSSAVGRAQRVAALRLLSFGRTLPGLVLQYVQTACAGLISRFANLWGKRALWAQIPYSGLAWLQPAHHGRAPSRLIRSNPDKAHAPPGAPASFRRGSSSDRAKRQVAA